RAVDLAEVLSQGADRAVEGTSGPPGRGEVEHDAVALVRVGPQLLGRVAAAVDGPHVVGDQRDLAVAHVLEVLVEDLYWSRRNARITGGCRRRAGDEAGQAGGQGRRGRQGRRHASSSSAGGRSRP